MDWLNYHHLFYFWVVAREGSIARAKSRLHLAQPTISAQLKALEKSLGVKLFSRDGRRMVLTDMGRMVLKYADEIFTIGRELMATVNERPVHRPLRFVVGVSQVVPMALVDELLKPIWRAGAEMVLACREGKLPELLAALSTHEMDVVIADQPADPSIKVKAFSHQLGECGISFLGSEAFTKLRKRFPHSLNGLPILLPGEATSTRRILEDWFESLRIHPKVQGEFDDVDLLQIFGRRNLGVFPVPSVIEKEICQQFKLLVIGRTTEIHQRFFAISVERRLVHPALIALLETARNKIFG
jgi:LysR family transcriptional activator of nhaA